MKFCLASVAFGSVESDRISAGVLLRYKSLVMFACLFACLPSCLSADLRVNVSLTRNTAYAHKHVAISMLLCMVSQLFRERVLGWWGGWVVSNVLPFWGA